MHQEQLKLNFLMTILEDCRASKSIKLTFQTRHYGDTRITYPTDGYEDSLGENVGWKVKTVSGLINVRCIPDCYRSAFLVWGTVVCRIHMLEWYDYRPDGSKRVLSKEYDGCGELLYWVTRNYIVPCDGSPVLNPDKPPYLFSATTGQPLMTGNYFIILKKDVWEARDFSPFEPGNSTYDKSHSYFKPNPFSYAYSRELHHPSKFGKSNTECFVTSQFYNSNALMIDPNTMQIEEVTSVKPYYRLISGLNADTPYPISVRSTKPTLATSPPYLTQPSKPIFYKEANTEDFEIVEIGKKVTLYKTTVSTGQRINLFGFQSDQGLAPPVYSYSCAFCPPNTCQVDCDTHYCCYGSDAIAVTSFLK